jgi:uncharacterized membrane protein YkvA (DUF1232 family)
LRFERWKQRARQLKRDTFALYLAYHDPRVPWYARLVVVLVVGYAFSPIDLIPDFVPVLGYLDDLVLLPLGTVLAIRLVPAEVMKECRASADVATGSGKPINRVAAMVIVAIWVRVPRCCCCWHGAGLVARRMSSPPV